MQIYEMAFPCKYIPLPSILIALKNIIKKKMHWPMEFILFIIHALGKKKKKILTTALFSVPHKESGF